MSKKEDFVIGMTIGGMLILCFYVLLFFPVLWLYNMIAITDRNLFKYVLATVLIILLINSVRGAYQSLKFIKQNDLIIQKIEQSAGDNLQIQSYVNEGLKYRLLVELALF